MKKIIKFKPPETTNDRLDLILEYMRRFDKRDKKRQFWGSIGEIIRMIPMLLFVAYSWYFYVNAEEIMNTMIDRAAEKAVQTATHSTTIITESINKDAILDKLREYIPN